MGMVLSGKRICLVARDAAYGNAAALSVGLSKRINIDTFFFRKDEKGFSDNINCKIVKKIPKGYDHYIVVSGITLMKIPQEVYAGKLTCILTDSYYMFNHVKVNKILKKARANVWAMPDLAGLAQTEQIYYQPFVVPELNLKKEKNVCHSPFHELKKKEKGTDVIQSVCSSIGEEVTIVESKTWIQAMEEKAKHRICVDQLYRGLGKSGLECFFLDTVVVSGEKPKGVKDLPPIVWTSKESLKKDLEMLIGDKELQESQVKKQREWANNNLMPEKVAEKIIKTIRL